MTDEVTNQPPPLSGTNAWRGDPLLVQLAEFFSGSVKKDLDSARPLRAVAGGAGPGAPRQHRDAEAQDA